jgi:multicomponent Na+:H+ antiporter subunit B
MTMKSLILSTATRYLLPLLLLFSIFVLLRGHNEPGGGFVGAMIASAAFALYAIAYDVAQARRALRVNPITLIGAGLLVAATSGSVPLLLGKPFMTAFWSKQVVPVLGKLGTPLAFEIGLYLTVLGVMLLIIFSLAEE